MSGQVAYLGSLTLGQCVPMAAQAVAGLGVSVSLSLPELTAKIQGLINVSAALTIQPPSLTASLEGALKMVASLQISGPTMTLQIGAVAQVMAEILATIGQIEALVELVAAINVVLGTPGIEAYVYTGTAGSLPPTLNPEFAGGMRIGGGPDMPAYALLLVATDAGAWSIMSRLFKTS